MYHTLLILCVMAFRSQCTYEICLVLKVNSDRYHKFHLPTYQYNGDALCLFVDANRIFKYHLNELRSSEG